MRKSKQPVVFGVCLAVVLAVGCSKKPSGEILEDKKNEPAVDPALKQAVAAASASGGPAAQATDGPPENGVFAPGMADQQILRGAPPKLTLGEPGAEPRALLSAIPKPGKHPVRVRLLAMRGGRAEIPLDLAVVFEVPKPKAPAAAPAASAAPVGSAAPPSGNVPVVAKITAAKIDSARVASVPADVEKLVKKLEGSKVSFEVLPSGTGTAFAVELAKGAEPGFASALNSLGDVLATVIVPYPAQPVGVGAMWMATTRESVLGIDTVSYRLVKVEGLSDELVKLQVSSRRYAADARQTIPGIQADGAVELQQFKAEGTGTIEVARASGLATSGQLTQELGALLLSGGAPQPMMIQERVQCLLGSPPEPAPGTAPGTPPGAPTEP